MDSSFKLQNGNEVVHITMTFGLLNTLCVLVGEIEPASLMVMDHNLRKEVLIEVLSERDENGEITKPFNVFALKATPQNVADLISWAQDHVLDFFMKESQRAVNKLLKAKGAVDELKSSLAGSESSPSETLSASSLTPSPQISENSTGDTPSTTLE